MRRAFLMAGAGVALASTFGSADQQSGVREIVDSAGKRVLFLRIDNAEGRIIFNCDLTKPTRDGYIRAHIRPTVSVLGDEAPHWPDMTDVPVRITLNGGRHGETTEYTAGLMWSQANTAAIDRVNALEGLFFRALSAESMTAHLIGAAFRFQLTTERHNMRQFLRRCIALKCGATADNRGTVPGCSETQTVGMIGSIILADDYVHMDEEFIGVAREFERPWEYFLARYDKVKR